MSDHPLKNKWLVVTRPKHQAASFTTLVQKVGGCILNFPLIEITPINDETTINSLKKLENYGMLIFVSSNAVEQCIKLIGTDILKNKTIVTVGKKTAQTLNSHNLSVTYCPNQYFNSEALLTIEAFKKQAKGNKIAIIRGSKGRSYLKNNLVKLGAEVDYIDVYSRHCPQHNLNLLKSAYQQNQLDAVVLTSASSTASFFELAKNENWVNQLTVLIGSPRMQHEIPSQFKGNILIAEDPSDETLFNTLTLALN